MVSKKSDFISPDQILESIMYSQELQDYSNLEGIAAYDWTGGYVDGELELFRPDNQNDKSA